MEDETNKIIEEIKSICKEMDSTNNQEVDIGLCDIIDLCNQILIK